MILIPPLLEKQAHNPKVNLSNIVAAFSFTAKAPFESGQGYRFRRKRQPLMFGGFRYPKV
jgi:hypothetical protein